MDRAPESLTQNALPQRYVAKIFQELQGNYGARFLNQWKTGQVLEDGTDAGVINAMSMWGKKLFGFIDRPECIRHVLDRLPNDPPTLPQFVELCRDAARRMGAAQAALPHKMTADDYQRSAQAARDAKRAVERADMDKVMFWATHPRSHMHFAFIVEAAKHDRRFEPAIATMIEQGVCSHDRHLQKVYQDGSWFPAGRAAA